MVKAFLRVMQLITTVMFFMALIALIGAFDPNTWQLGSLLNILGALKNFFSYFIYLVMGMASQGPTFLFGYSSGFIVTNYSVMEPLQFQFLNLFFHMTDEGGNLITFSSFNDMLNDSPTPSIFSYMGGQALTIMENGYMLFFLILIFLAFIYFLMYISKLDIKYSIYSTVCMLGTFILVFFPGLILTILDMISLKNANVESFFTTYFSGASIVNPLLVSGNIPANFSFFIHPVFIHAFLVYVYLELSFQTSYVGRVTRPSILRTRRLESQIAVLGEQSSAFELEKERQMQEKSAKTRFIASGGESKKRITLKSFFQGEGVEAIRELIERREREREKERLEEVSSDTRRLNKYIKRLFETNPESKQTLTALGSAPSQKNMVASTFIQMGIRLGVLVLMVFVMTNPILFYQVFGVPQIISESVGFSNPEAIVTVVVPIGMLFPLIAFLIRTYKKYKLSALQAKKEEESEILRKLAELREIEEEETLYEDDTQTATTNP